MTEKGIVSFRIRDPKNSKIEKNLGEIKLAMLPKKQTYGDIVEDALEQYKQQVKGGTMKKW